MSQENKGDIRKPEQGQQGNENWDDQNEKTRDTSADSDETTRAIDSRNTSPAGSQTNKKENVGPLDADLEPLPSSRRTPGSNLTGPGLG